MASDMSEEERKIHGKDLGGSSGHEDRSETGWKGGLGGMYSVGSSKTHHIPQPEIQLLKEAGEADSLDLSSILS